LHKKFLPSKISPPNKNRKEKSSYQYLTADAILHRKFGEPNFSSENSTPIFRHLTRNICSVCCDKTAFFRATPQRMPCRAGDKGSALNNPGRPPRRDPRKRSAGAPLGGTLGDKKASD